MHPLRLPMPRASRLKVSPCCCLQSWQTGPEGQQKLKAFLIKELGLRFDEVPDQTT
jgi:hypothetical protein